jgi:hypothetical protein
MPAFPSTCESCGSDISMVQTRNGWFPYDRYSYGVRHKCNSHRFTTQSLARHVLETDGEPKTRRTACWWCGDEVYYHTNGNGDSVLLEELGPPWPVHGCWELYRASRSERLHPFLNSLVGSVGVAVQPEPDWPVGLDVFNVTEQNKGGQVWVNGFIFGWSEVQGENSNTLRNPGDTEGWTRFRIVTSGGVGCPVWVPTCRASLYRLNDLVEVVCRLVPWGPRWYLVALRGTVIRYAGLKGATERLARIGRKVRCRFCGEPLNRENIEWGIDRDWRPECRVCNEFRGDRSPEEFRRLCLKVQMHGRVRP